MSNYSEGQVHQLANALEASGFTPEDVTKLGQHRELGDFRFVLDGQAEIVRNNVELAKVYLRQIFSDVEVGEVDGSETFESSGLFTGGVYGVAVPSAAKGKPTLTTKATVWEMILDVIFSKLFRSLGENRKRWTEAQVVQFCRDHRNMLRKDGYGTFFEMEGGFVAGVDFGGRGQLRVDVYSVSGGYVWHAVYQHRLVSLQQ